MQYVKKWKKYIASLLAFAMLISNFTPSLPTIYAQSNDEEISSIELEQNNLQSEEEQTEVEEVNENTETTDVENTSTLTIHYNRNNNDYDGWDL